MFRIVDSIKLSDERPVIDLEIMSICFREGISRPEAYARVAKQFGLSLGMCPFVGGQVMMFAVTEDFSALQADIKAISPDEIGRDEKVTSLLTRAVAGMFANFVIANSPDEAATAILLLQLDANADLFVSQGGFFDMSEDRHAEWQRVLTISAPPSPNILASESLDCPEQLLWETDAEFRERRRKSDIAFKVLSSIRNSFGLVA